MKIIISNTNIGAMLKTVDEVLKDIPKDDVPDKLKGQATLSALKSMFSKNHFSVCDIQGMAKMNDTYIPAEISDYFHTLHCVNFADMTEETRSFLFAKCVDLFRSNIVMANSNYEMGR